MPSGLSDVVVAEVLAPFATAKWLHFLDVSSAFGGFANPTHNAEYEGWLDKAILPWCCKPSGDEGGSMGHADNVGSGVVGEVGEAASMSLLHNIVEVPTGLPGWVGIEIKARPAEQAATA